MQWTPAQWSEKQSPKLTNKSIAKKDDALNALKGDISLEFVPIGKVTPKPHPS